MAQSTNPFSITRPGFLGLNIQDAPVGLDPSYALVASNCVIDHSGRIAARKGWVPKNTPNTDLGTNDITCIGEVVEDDGTRTIIAAGGGHLFVYSLNTLTTLTYGGANTAPVITANNWQFCQLSGHGIFWQRGHDPLVYDPAVSTTTFKRLSEKTGGSGVVNQCNTAISAYGRIWAADTLTDKGTVVFSDLLAPHQWSGGTSGSLDVREVWPLGGDEIVALASHNNFLLIFGKRQTLIYSGANDPSTMALSDSINNIGCIARDSVQDVGEDIIFLSDSGVRSIMRTIQEKSSPLRELSRNVRDEIQYHIGVETLEDIKSAYSPVHAFYLITMPATDETYCFDTRQVDSKGSSRITTWSGVTAKGFCQCSTRELLTGRAGVIGEYDSYFDNTDEYRFAYRSPWLDFGNPIQTSILKSMVYTLTGVSNQALIFKWAFDFDANDHSDYRLISGVPVPAEYGASEYGIAEFGGGAFVTKMKVNGSNSGQVLQVGIEKDINGFGLSIQKIDILTKDGKL